MIEAVVSRSRRQYKLNDFGRAAVNALLAEGEQFQVDNLGPDDRCTLTVSVRTDDGSIMTHVNLDIHASMLEEL